MNTHTHTKGLIDIIFLAKPETNIIPSPKKFIHYSIFILIYPVTCYSSFIVSSIDIQRNTTLKHIS